MHDSGPFVKLTQAGRSLAAFQTARTMNNTIQAVPTDNARVTAAPIRPSDGSGEYPIRPMH